MFQELNEDDGITIILVTHDANVSRHAKRIIHIHDGLIVDGAFSSREEPDQPQAISTPPAAKAGGVK